MNAMASAVKSRLNMILNPEKIKLKRWAPLVVVLMALAALFAFDLDRFFSLQLLKDSHEAIKQVAVDQPLLAPLGMIALYAGLTAISFPGAALLTIFSGFMFGTVAGGTYVVIGATIGASIIFMVAKTSLGDSLRGKAGPWMEKFEKGFQENEFNYLLALRLVPAFPFWLVNLAPASLG